MVWQYRKLDALLLVPTNNNFVYRNKANLCRNNGTTAAEQTLYILFSQNFLMFYHFTNKILFVSQFSQTTENQSSLYLKYWSKNLNFNFLAASSTIVPNPNPTLFNLEIVLPVNQNKKMKI